MTHAPSWETGAHPGKFFSVASLFPGRETARTARGGIDFLLVALLFSFAFLSFFLKGLY